MIFLHLSYRATHLSSRYYVNPFIKNKLLNVQYGAANQEANSEGFNGMFSPLTVY